MPKISTATVVEMGSYCGEVVKIFFTEPAIVSPLSQSRPKWTALFRIQ